VRRNGLEYAVKRADFDNPLLEQQYEVRSSGSRSAGSRAFADLNLLAYEAAHVSLLLQAHGVADQPIAVWRPMLPSFTGLNAVLRYTRLGRTPARWFSQSRPRRTGEGLRARLLLGSTILSARRARRKLPWPAFGAEAGVAAVARWLAESRARGRPGVLDTSASGAAHVCICARDSGLDISGSVFRVGGEPYTAAKAALVDSAGAWAVNRYAATDLGDAGLGCALASQPDDMHLLVDKMLALQRPKSLGPVTVPALVFSSLHPNSRKILLNVESGDYGTLEERSCGCLLGQIGFSTHVTDLYGYDKLTSEGVNFLGADLYTLVEHLLPARFGGHATDYQLLEQEDQQGRSRVAVLVAPAVGAIDERAVIDCVVEALSALDGPHRGPLMASQWRQAETLRVLRREPLASGDRKVLPLHVLTNHSASVPPLLDVPEATARVGESDPASDLIDSFVNESRRSP
jgi:hypothetical protein